MKKFLGLIITLAFIASGSLYADSAAGGAIVKKKGCTSCHDPVKDQLDKGMGPSWANVAAAYKKGSGKDGLLKFFAGSGDPIVAPEKFSTMKSQLRVTKKLSDEEKGNLADFVLSH
jgi:cytochrome c551/c552